MQWQKWAFVYGVIVLGAIMAASTFVGGIPAQSPWFTWLALVIMTFTGHVFPVDMPNKQVYNPHLVFYFAGAVLLPPPLFVLLAVVCHLIEAIVAWVDPKKPNPLFYETSYNLAIHIIPGLSAASLYAYLQQNPLTLLGIDAIVNSALAAFTFVAINHLLLGLVIVIFEGFTWKESGVWDSENVFTEFTLAYLGYAFAVLWNINPWLIVPALLPLWQMYRALMLPMLQEQARTDSKTGLFNARYFTDQYNKELDKAQKTGKPLSLIMSDLDYLRHINNTYGHLAGDAVLSGIAKVIRRTIRPNDLAARFGGEEFTIVLPETTPEQACELAEKLRAAIEASEFPVETSETPLRATISLGIATFPFDAPTAARLTHQADIAVYQAKVTGRNRVVYVGDISPATRAAGIPTKGPESAALQQEGATPPPTDMPAMPMQAAADAGANAPIVPHAPVSPPQPAPHATTLAVTPLQESISTGEPTPPTVRREDGASSLLWMFVGSVITAGFAVTLLSVFQSVWATLLLVVLLLALLAIIAELLQIDLYGEGSVSVSVAVGFAAALIAGLPGVIIVSAAIAGGSAIARFFRTHRRPPLHRLVFNWAAHVLSGSAVVLVMAQFQFSLQFNNLPALVFAVLVAAVCYFIIDTGLVAIAVSLSERRPLQSIWREGYQWLASHYLVLCLMGFFLSTGYTVQGNLGIIIFAMPVLMLRYAQQQYVSRTRESVQELRRLNTHLQQANQEAVAANESFRRLNDELFLTLAKIIDARDPSVASHSAKVADYATAIAREMQLPTTQVEHLRLAALLHDIGKIGISEQILLKPGKLTREEYEVIKTHAALGANLLETSHSLRHLVPFVRHHHERWDGKGYPDGLAGDTTPLEGRILAICDAVEVMASDRPYQRAKTIPEIISEIRRSAGSHFDPHIAEVFIGIIEREGSRLVVNSARALPQPPPAGAPSLPDGLAALPMPGVAHQPDRTPSVL
jgi:diguanylate cyclase (GGDEF)-like protein/putative nucleotidyltransferase with HDIG domain